MLFCGDLTILLLGLAFHCFVIENRKSLCHSLGRPSRSDFVQLQFSISHSGYIVLCGCDDKKIGVDVQEKKNNSLYNPYTLSAIEAYFKMQEKIISSNSLHWKVDNEKNYNISSISDENIKYYIYQKTVVNDKYIISVSTPRKLSGGIKINKIKYTDLLNENFYERVSENNE